MQKHVSYGIIAVKRVPEYQVLLIKQKSGNHWTLTKGHQEANETGMQTAIRELKEEVNLAPKEILLGERMFSNNYQYGNIDKTNHFYVGLVDEDGLKIQEEEVEAFKWVSLTSAFDQVTYETDKSVLVEVAKALQIQ